MLRLTNDMDCPESGRHRRWCHDGRCELRGYYCGRNNAGSTATVLRYTAKCRCGPVARPVAPTLPMRVPADTSAATVASTALKWAYSESSPCPWSRVTVCPERK